MNKSKGFALIEITIYLALFGLLFSGLLCAAATMAQNFGRSGAQIMLVEEGAFLLAKIEQEKDISVFVLENGVLKMNGTTLNGNEIAVADLQFSGFGGQSMKAKFVLSAKTDGGQTIAREFSTTYFLAK